jgi:hypothetical protein
MNRRTILAALAAPLVLVVLVTTLTGPAASSAPSGHDSGDHIVFSDEQIHDCESYTVHASVRIVDIPAAQAEGFTQWRIDSRSWSSLTATFDDTLGPTPLGTPTRYGVRIYVANADFSDIKDWPTAKTDPSPSCHTTTTVPDSTVPPPDSTMPPPDSTIAPPDSTIAPPDSTIAPPDSTIAPPDSTIAPPDSTTPPSGTVAPAPSVPAGSAPPTIPAGGLPVTR